MEYLESTVQLIHTSPMQPVLQSLGCLSRAFPILEMMPMPLKHISMITK